MIWSALAEADLSDIHAFVAADNPAAARMLAEAIVEAADGLAEFPLKGHSGVGGSHEWPVPRFRRYLLIYEVDATAKRVWILRVWHQSRERPFA